MKTIFYVLFFALAALFIVGCAHNPFSLLGGEQTRLGFGEYGTYNATRGLLLTDVPRENTSLEVEIDSEHGIQYNPTTGTIKGITRIRRKVGPQITGYLVDLAEAAPEAAKEYLRHTAAGQAWDSVPATAASGGGEAISAILKRLDAIEDFITTPEVDK